MITICAGIRERGASTSINFPRDPRVSNNPVKKRKPRLWLRLFLVLMLMAAIAGALGYKKFLQIQALDAQANQAPAAISVTVATAEKAQWKRQIIAIGTLVASQSVDITSEVAGVVRSIKFQSGEEISKMALMVELDNRSEMAALALAKTRFNADQRQHKRLLKLKDQAFVTQTDIDAQAALVEVAEARINVAKAELSKKSLYAPFSGKLGIRQVDIGEYIAPGTTVVSLQTLDNLFLDFTLPERNFKDLAVGQSISFKVRSYPDRNFKARVQTWNPELDASTRNISIRATVNNRKRLLAPGMFAQMKVGSKQRQAVVTLPETSIFYNIYGEAVYVLEESDTTDAALAPDYRLAARQVQVAYRNNGVVGISDGVDAGDIVVTSGQLKLYPSLRVVIVDDVPEFKARN